MQYIRSSGPEAGPNRGPKAGGDVVDEGAGKDLAPGPEGKDDHDAARSPDRKRCERALARASG